MSWERRDGLPGGAAAYGQEEGQEFREEGSYCSSMEGGRLEPEALLSTLP